MSICTFFGHRDCPETVKGDLHRAIEDLIAQGVDTFYVGNQGQFDTYARSILRQLQDKYPIHYTVVLSHLPTEKGDYEDTSDTMFPEELENVHPKFAIDRRNKWLVDRADHVICYVRYSWGGAYKFARLASRRGKKVINLAKNEPPIL